MLFRGGGIGHRSIFNSVNANAVSASLFDSIRVYPSYIHTLQEEGIEEEEEPTDANTGAKSLPDEGMIEDDEGITSAAAGANIDMDDDNNEEISDESEADYTMEDDSAEDEDTIESEEDENEYVM